MAVHADRDASEGPSRTTDEHGPDLRAASLIGDIMAANYSAYATTTDRIIEGKDAQIRTLAQDVVDLWEIVQKADVVDRKTEARLQWFAPRIYTADRVLESCGDGH